MARYIEGAENCPTRIGSITPIGAKGNPGKSAYQVAVDNGFVGTVEEWLASLKGEQGEQGERGLRGATGAKGDKGDKGDPGISYVSLQDEYDAWHTLHPSDDVLEFLQTIEEPGFYEFSESNYLDRYELIKAEDEKFYGKLDAYDNDADGWIRTVYVGSSVDTLARVADLEAVSKGFLADQHYLSATATPTSSTAGMQDVYRDNTTGKLVTPAGGGGAVRYDEPQALASAQQEQARENIGAYAQPSSGIPKADLAQSVQDSLDNADDAATAINALTPIDIVKSTTVLQNASADNKLLTPAAAKALVDDKHYTINLTKNGEDYSVTETAERLVELSESGKILEMNYGGSILPLVSNATASSKLYLEFAFNESKYRITITKNVSPMTKRVEKIYTNITLKDPVTIDGTSYNNINAAIAAIAAKLGA